MRGGIAGPASTCEAIGFDNVRTNPTAKVIVRIVGIVVDLFGLMTGSCGWVLRMKGFDRVY
jgi:hypothetical protein